MALRTVCGAQMAHAKSEHVAVDDRRRVLNCWPPPCAGRDGARVAMELQSKMIASGHGTLNLVLCIVSRGPAVYDRIRHVQVPPWPVSASACLVACFPRQITSGPSEVVRFAIVWPGGGMPECTAKRAATSKRPLANEPLLFGQERHTCERRA